MGLQQKNYDVVQLSGTQNINTLGDGVTAQTPHQIYCLSTGTITITPCAGSSFTWSGTTNTSIDICFKASTVNSGSFIAFRAKHVPIQFFNPSYPQTDIGGS
jgi:hypothetical protein